MSPHTADKRGFFEQQAFESVYGIGERIALRNRAQPRRKRLNRDRPIRWGRTAAC